MLKQIWNERKTNAWLWVELLLVFVALWFMIDWSYVNLYTYKLPLGFNIDNTYKLVLNELTPQSPDYVSDEQKTTIDGEDFLTIIERFKHHPDVEHVSVSLNSTPYSGSNSGGKFRQDSIYREQLRRQVTPDFFNVFQYQNMDGSGSQTLAEALQYSTLIVSSNFWEERYPNGKNLLNQTFYQVNDSTTQWRVSAVTQPVRYTDFMAPTGWMGTYVATRLEDYNFVQMESSDFPHFEVSIRTRAGTSTDFAGNLLKDAPRLYNVGNCYIQSVRSFEEIRHYTNLSVINDLKKRGFIMLFLLVNIFLGIIGTFWYRTQQRRSELGLRIALGSSRFKLNWLLIGEGLLLLLLAIIPAFIICYNIGSAELSDAWQMEWGMPRFIPGILITLLVMTLMIIIGIWYPAHQAMRIQPAEALHEE